MHASRIKQLARESGFEIAGICAAIPTSDRLRFLDWIASGMAGSMHYLTDHRAQVRADPRSLLPSARSILCVGKLYNRPEPPVRDPNRGWISRYAWGEDYHDVMRRDLEQLATRLSEAHGPFEYKICVDTAPLLERSYAHQAGIGWIGKNTCLINQQIGSWVFLGEILLSLDIEPDVPAPDRCGTCTRCIEACPTDAFIPDGHGRYQLDARRCISYWTIEHRGDDVPAEIQQSMGNHIFGCDICQDVCPWNRKAPYTTDPAFAPQHYAPPLEKLAELTPDEFRSRFRRSPVWRTKFGGFLRNVKIAMGLMLLFCSIGLGADLLPGFESFYNLEYDQAIQAFQSEISAHSDDPAGYNHLAEAALYRELYRAGALETGMVMGNDAFVRRSKVNPAPENVNLFETSIAKALETAEARLAKNPNDAYALYHVGIAHGLRANYSYLIRRAWIDGLHDATAARRAHARVVELNPSFVDAQLTQGIYQYLVGCLPWHYRVLGVVAGFHGDREGGIKTLENVAEHGDHTKYDARIALAALYRREHQPAKAVAMAKGLAERFPRNYIVRLELAQMFADAGDKTRALAVLDNVEEMHRNNTAGYSNVAEEKIAYYRGSILFRVNDLNNALSEMRKATGKPNGLDLNSSIVAWTRVGQIHDLQGQRNQAVEAYKHAVALAPQSDATKEPRAYLSSPYRRS